MNQDPVFQRLKEIGWRRALTTKEQAELNAWLVAHPEAQAEVTAEAALNTSLARTRDIPVPSNFTARVLDAIHQEAPKKAQAKTASSSHWWTVFLPRLAVASAVVIAVVIGYRHDLAVKQTELTEAAKQIAEAQTLSDISVMEDFETIRTLDSVTVTVDENLLAMSDDLLALNK